MLGFSLIGSLLFITKLFLITLKSNFLDANFSV
jgi:hypothetical protein